MRCSKYPPFTSTQALIRTADRVPRKLTRSPRYTTPCVRLDIHFLSSFVVRLSSPNVSHLSSGNSLITISSPYPIIRYKISINALTFFSKRNLRGYFMTLLEITKNRRLIITNTIENWYSELVKEVIINSFHLKMQLLPATRQDSGELITGRAVAAALY